MKIYGLSDEEFEAPDQLDLIRQARKGSAGNLPGKGGEIKPIIRSTVERRRIRKSLKAKERRNNTIKI